MYPQIVRLKLKTSDFKLIVVSAHIENYTNSAEIIFQTLLKLLYKSLVKGPFRLIGVSFARFMETPVKFQTQDLFKDSGKTIDLTEQAIDEIREKFGPKAIIKGRSLNVK